MRAFIVDLQNSASRVFWRLVAAILIAIVRISSFAIYCFRHILDSIYRQCILAAAPSYMPKHVDSVTIGIFDIRPSLKKEEPYGAQAKTA